MLNNTDFLNPNNIKSAKIWIHYLNILAIFFGKYDINRQDSIIYFKTLIIPAILNSRLEYEIPFVLVTFETNTSYIFFKSIRKSKSYIILKASLNIDQSSFILLSTPFYSLTFQYIYNMNVIMYNSQVRICKSMLIGARAAALSLT